MPGSVHVSPDGVVSGWAFRCIRPQRSVELDILLDGRRVARLRTSESAPAALACDPRAERAGFTYRLDGELHDGRVHQLNVRLAWAGELYGSPTVWEPRRRDAPARSFVLEREPSVAGRRDDGSLMHQHGWIRFDRSSFRKIYAGGSKQLVQNQEHIGGLPGHRLYRPWPAYLAAFRDHHVDASFGGVYRPQGALWQGSTYLSNSLAQKITRHRVRQGEVVPAPAERCFLLSNSVKDTYFHWHLDCLAGLVMARDRLGGSFRTLAPAMLKPWQTASLALLGEAVEPMARVCRPIETIVASHLDGRGISPDRWVVRLFERLRRAHAASGGQLSPGLGPRLFISRRDAGHRVLENEAELWAALQPLGFHRFIPGEASYAEQIEAFARAEVVVASHGSALTNIGFCQPRARVIEILPSDYLNGCFRYLSIALGLRHAWYSTDLVAPFRVDVGDFMHWCGRHRLL
jgi:capsular polysaccharide biosynthesis protein